MDKDIILVSEEEEKNPNFQSKIYVESRVFPKKEKLSQQ